MQEQLAITDMPKEIIRHITSFVDERYDRKELASACCYLHDSVATENKELVMRCGNKRGALSIAEFLGRVFTGIQHIAMRQGNNPITIDLGYNDLSSDMKAVSTFLTKCSQTPIVQHIVTMYLWGNKFTTLPEEIKGFTYLKGLNLGNNALTVKDLILLEKIINESLKQLEWVNVNKNKSINPHDVYQTIGRCPLKYIAAYHLEGGHDFKPTPEELQGCKAKEISC